MQLDLWIGGSNTGSGDFRLVLVNGAGIAGLSHGNVLELIDVRVSQAEFAYKRCQINRDAPAGPAQAKHRDTFLAQHIPDIQRPNTCFLRIYNGSGKIF